MGGCQESGDKNNSVLFCHQDIFSRERFEPSMTPKTQQRIVDAMEKMATRLGRPLAVRGLEGVMRLALRLIEGSKANEDFLRAVIVKVRGRADGLDGKDLHATLSRIQSREKVTALLADAPEPPPTVVANQLAEFREAPRVFREVMLPLIKALPHRAGRSPSLTSEEAAMACQKVERLKSQYGRGTKEAQRQVAREQGIDLRTVQRYWAEWKASRIR